MQQNKGLCERKERTQISPAGETGQGFRIYAKAIAIRKIAAVMIMMDSNMPAIPGGRA
jgi:hypothetical protein